MKRENREAANAALSIGSLGAQPLVIVPRATACKVCGLICRQGEEARRFFSGVVHPGCLDAVGLSPKGGL